MPKEDVETRKGLVVGKDYESPAQVDPQDTLVSCVECRNVVCTPGNFCPCCGARN